MKIYTFKVALDFNKRTYRNIELSENHTLKDFHNIIFEAFDRYDEHLYSFYITKKSIKNQRNRWQAPEFTVVFEDDQDNISFSGKEKFDVAKTKVGELNLNEKDKLYYLFDFGDEWWHEVTLLSIKESKNITLKPKIVKIAGKSPDQYPDYEDEDFE